MRALLCALLLAGASLLAGALPSTYQCTPSTTVGCASTSPPGGLAPAEIPQFIVLTHDDAITVATKKAVRGVVDQFSNPNGCNVPVTFFVSGGAGTNCAIAMRLYQLNHEIATHTLLHSALTPGSVDIKAQIQGQRDFLHQTCGIPLEDLVGFRAPYLLHNPESRQVLQELGFKYDSSIVESWPSATSPASSARLFPYSMAAGIPQDCQWMAPSTCSASERYAGLWEVPMLQFLEGPVTNGKAVALSTMDPDAANGDALLAQLLQQFEYSYQGNRAPMGLYLHTPWFAAQPYHAEALTAFIGKVLKEHDDVYFVTMSTLVRWMKSPVKASQMRDWLRCNPVDFAADEREPCSIYTVKSGDTIFSILAEQEVELADLVAVNPSLQNNTSGALTIGSRLRLPPWTDECGDTLAGQPLCRNHTVVMGDSLYAIAEAAGLTTDDIVAANAGLTATSTLSIGQVLHLPPWPIECQFGNFTVIPVPVSTPSTPNTTTDSPVPEACGTELVELDMVVTGFDAQSFAAQLESFTAGLSALVREPVGCITVRRTEPLGASAAGTRRLLATGRRSLLTDPQLLLSVDIATSNGTLVFSYLKARGAEELNSLGLMMSLLGAASVDSVAYTAVDSLGTPVASTLPISGVPAPAPSPVPTPAKQPPVTTAQPAGASAAVPEKDSHLGAILGGAIGGGVGALLLVALVFYVHKRRQAASGGMGRSGLRATFNPTYNNNAGALASVRTSAPAKVDERLELAEVVEQTGTPTSARRRNNAAF